METPAPRGRKYGTIVMLFGTLIAVAGVTYIVRNPPADASSEPGAATKLVITENPDAAREAFLAAYTVFMHARCVNCHPVGDAPLQGDQSVTHSQNVQRGVDGRGKFALKCANCHQDTNLPGQYMPPGAPGWHLPPENMKMVFQGKSAAELCAQLKDPAQNGGKTIEQILEHVTHDALVLWGWNPGDGRSKPPMSHEEFVAKMKAWVENGAACPE